MNIHLHIDRLVLDGVELACGEEALLRATLVNRLQTMLANNSSTQFTDCAARMAKDVRHSDARSLGRGLASGIYHALATNATAPSSPDHSAGGPT